MGKTIRRVPHSYFRRPRGRKQALIQGARKKAIPPDSWDDISHNRECRLPYILGRRFYDEGMSREDAIRILRGKFRLSQSQAKDATYRWEFKTQEDYAEQAFESLSREEQVAIRLRYEDLVEWHQDLLCSYERVDECAGHPQ